MIMSAPASVLAKPGWKRKSSRKTVTLDDHPWSPDPERQMAATA
jgi:hypothetical protein